MQTIVAALGCLLLAACAHRGATEEMSPRASRRAAARIYEVAEQRFAAADYADAAKLMRHAILQLPPSVEHDALRHRLVLRLGYTQMRAAAAIGRVEPLLDARAMLERYVERHVDLFGDGKAAMGERADVYALLGEVERHLAMAEAEPRTTSPNAAASEPEPEPEPQPEIARAAAPEPARQGDRAREGASKHDPIHVEDGEPIVRKVVVRTRQLARLDDPHVMERLRSDFSDPNPVGGFVLTRPGVEAMHGPRPLVRGRAGLAGAGDRQRVRLARDVGRTLLRTARESLSRCYAEAFVRRTVPVAGSTVEASVDPDGTVRQVRVTEGGLVDALGDVCVIEALSQTNVEPIATADTVRVRMALTFFYEDAVYIVEGTGEEVPAGGIAVDLVLPGMGIPSLDALDRPQ